MEGKYILVINAGSATLKFKIFKADSLGLVLDGIVERIGLLDSFIKIGDKKEIYEVENHKEAFRLMLRHIKDYINDINLIGHRVVHGAEDFVEPVLINKAVIKKLKRFNKLAPLHNPINITCIKEGLKAFKNIKNVAVFDTAFYKTLPDYAFIYALPLEYYKKHKIRRYGFHGTSHQYVAGQAAQLLKKPLAELNIITCHLGSGCSITAIKNGAAIDTSMGFTPLEGVVMATRCGSIDPSIPLYMTRELRMKDEKVYALLNNHSGLMGLCGTKDMREVLAKAGYEVEGFKLERKVNGEEKKSAQLALNIFIYSIKKQIGAYLAVLGKIDAVVFTAGVGERNETVRELIMSGFPDLRVLVVPTNEELQIARLIADF